MYTRRQTALLLLLACAAATQTLAARSLQQDDIPRVVKGLKRKYGSAEAYFAQLDQDEPGTLDSIIDTNFPAGRTKLAKELNRNADMGLDLDNKAVIFSCSGLAAAATPPSDGPSATSGANSEIASGYAPGGPDPLPEQAFNLSSRPSAVKKLYLDFTGYTLTGSVWNKKRADPITIPAYDTDGDPSTFNTSELAAIGQIWRFVAEDYAAWDIDVTTIEPVPFNGYQHVRVAIGGDSSWLTGKQYDSGVGGAAYVDIAFNSKYNIKRSTFFQPALVFPKNLYNGYPKYVGEAISHELGHTLGLTHDGRQYPNGTLEEYYFGQGVSLNGSWAPIMGVGYYQQMTQFSKGEYLYANNQQDDVAIISAKVDMLTGGNGNSIATATPLDLFISGSMVTGTGSGIIAQQDVADVFSFTADAGMATFGVRVVYFDSFGWTRTDLDVLLVVSDSTGAVVQSFNPPGTRTSNGLGIDTVSVNLTTPGTYYASVYGSGYLDPLTNGYSSYGSKGQYALTATFPAPSVGGGGASPMPGLSVSLGSVAWVNRKGPCVVTVVVTDAAGTPQSGANVTGMWSTVQGVIGSSSGTTDGSGTTLLLSAAVKKNQDRYCSITVLSATKAGYSGANNLPQSASGYP